MKKLLYTGLLCGLFVLSGCCSIVGSRDESVSFNANVEDAKMTIKNKSGMVVYSGKIPTTISLKKKASYFSGETYTISTTKSGYVNQEQILDTGLSGWYWGNILFGGLIGLFIVDPVTGAMWTFDDDKVFINLSKTEQ